MKKEKWFCDRCKRETKVSLLSVVSWSDENKESEKDCELCESCLADYVKLKRKFDGEFVRFMFGATP